MFSYTLTVARFTFFNLACIKLSLSHNYVIFSNKCERFLGVKMYLNLQESKAVFSDNKGKFGIYRFVKLPKGYVYIGSSADLSCRFRYSFSLSPK